MNMPIVTSEGESAVAVTKEKAFTLPEAAKALIITDIEQYNGADEFLKQCKLLETRIHDDLDEPVKAAHTSWKSAVALRDKYLLPVEEARRIVRFKMGAYRDEEERKRKEEEAAREAELRRQAEDAQIAAAAEAEKAGDKTTAAAILNEDTYVPPVVVPKTAPAATRGNATRTQWYAEVVDIRALCKAVAEGKVPTGFIEANMPALNKMATASKSEMNIPGVVAKSRRV